MGKELRESPSRGWTRQEAGISQLLTYRFTLLSTCLSPLHKKHLLRLTTDEKMHCRPTLGPRCVDLLVITADEFVGGAAATDALPDPEDRLQLLRLLPPERRLGADSEEGVQEEGELQGRVVFRRLVGRLWGGVWRPQS